MEWVEIIGALGGIGAISATVSALVTNLISSRIIEKHKAKLTHDLETYKSELGRTADRQRLLLKRQELMFEKEYAAASEFYRLFSGIRPEPWAPDLDWSDAQADIANNFHKHATELQKFLRQHAASVSLKVRKNLERAQETATEGVFMTAVETGGEDYDQDLIPGDQVRQTVDKFYDLLSQADEEIRRDLENGSFALTQHQ
ncbi:MAG: hypothetical protein Q4G22_07720 [Paracoccus sp. (in: a-proteobacteria)]|uniref:hypothetical protein n=1 Tax=Paracoccus sp. TaxID=267 RepID=UPI0026DFA1EF|nr:hypothetical protein [Paracoccus sp. (in: a-proteobacteria)]MDO5631710.1 hypothetical protein [Paracoccus sp. (in: a-proteobacteria)]